MIETAPNTFPSLCAAYTVLWLILGGYIFSLMRRIAKLEKKLEERQLKSNPPGA